MNQKMYEFINEGKSCAIYDAKPPRYLFNSQSIEAEEFPKQILHAGKNGDDMLCR